LKLYRGFNNSLDCDLLVKTSNCCPGEKIFPNAQSDLGVFATYADIKGMPGITRKLKGAVIDKADALLAPLYCGHCPV